MSKLSLKNTKTKKSTRRKSRQDFTRRVEEAILKGESCLGFDANDLRAYVLIGSKLTFPAHYLIDAEGEIKTSSTICRDARLSISSLNWSWTGFLFNTLEIISKTGKDLFKFLLALSTIFLVGSVSSTILEIMGEKKNEEVEKDDQKLRKLIPNIPGMPKKISSNRTGPALALAQGISNQFHTLLFFLVTYYFSRLGGKIALSSTKTKLENIAQKAEVTEETFDVSGVALDEQIEECFHLVSIPLIRKRLLSIDSEIPGICFFTVRGKPRTSIDDIRRAFLVYYPASKETV